MKSPPLVKGILKNRDNRFRATVSVGGADAWAHVPNSGRLGELLTPGRSIWLAPAGSPERKTAYDLKLVEFENVLVSVDARLPNPLFAEALANGAVPGFDYPVIKPEVVRGNSRLDFRLSSPDGICWVETKSVTLVRDGTALFPDAPTDRGRKHLRELIDIVDSGDRAAVFFVIQRPDAVCFSPNRETDPDFTETLGLAARAGVSIRAVSCHISLAEIRIRDEIPVVLQ
jgi:sugar fermentation stimulation protein A